MPPFFLSFLTFLLSILAFVVVLSPLVFFHELGHYLAAKACGVHVERFSIGFGPKIVSWRDKAGTEWIFSWILLGGYVQMLGDGNVASSVSTEVAPMDRSKTMAGKTRAQRIFISAAGPGINYLLAFVMLVGLFVTVGKPHHKTLVGDIPEISHAYLSGIRKNDRLESIQGQGVKTFEETLKILEKVPATQPLEVVITREEERVGLVIPPVEKASGVWLGKLKFFPAQEARFYEKQGVFSAIGDTLSMINPLPMLKALKFDSMGGPISIAHQAGNFITQGWIPVLFFMASLSVGLGFFNLLPLPVLDGGNIMMELIEGITGVSLSQRVREIIAMVSFGTLAVFVIFLSWGDLIKIPAIERFLPAPSTSAQVVAREKA